MNCLLDNQRNAINKLNSLKVGALFMSPGEGKTRTMIEIVKGVDIDYVLYIAPFSAINPPSGVKSIKEEVTKWGGFNAETEYMGVESIGMSGRIYLQTLSKIQTKINPLIIVDESIKIKNFDAKRTKRVLEISKHAQYKLIANGTFVTRDLLDLWAQMQFLSPKILSIDLPQFKNTFCCITKVTKQIGSIRQEKEFITGYENIDYLYSLIDNYIYESDTEIDIEREKKSIRYCIDDEIISEYNALKKKYLDDETMQWKNNNIFLEMTQKMQHLYSCCNAKTEAVRSIMKEIEPKKTVIFCKYIDSQILCREMFPECLILSYQKNALSINLQHDYHTMIFWDKVWDYFLVKQAHKRIDRIGQENKLSFYYLTGNVGLEKLIDANIGKKTSMVDYFKKISLEQLKKEL